MPFKKSYFIKPDAEFVREFSMRNLAPMFRKSFTVKKTERARLSICGLGYAYCYINGKRVSEDLFTAPVSNYEKTLWFNAYDVSHLLKAGKNTVAVICGNGWYNESVETNWKFHEAAWRDNPKFILSLDIDGDTALVSDGTWKCQPHSATYFNQLRMGEYFDANLYEENWTHTDFNDAEWQNAVIDVNAPKGIFRECTCEPIRVSKTYSPINVIKNGVDSYVFDMGQNMSGYIRLTTVGNKGDELTIRYAECINGENQLEYYGMDSYYCKNGGFQTDKFICSGKRMTWSPMFVYHGFRYIEIRGLHDFESTKVEALFVHQNVERRTSFECSDPYLNKLFDCAVVSSRSNMFYMLTDCPSREKFGWTNDAQSSCEQLITNFKIEKLLTKWHQDIKDAMQQNGALPGIIPTAGWGYHWGNGPVSDGILFEIPYRIYLHTGDGSLLTESIEYFERYLLYLESRKNEDGLIEFGLDDWAAPGQIHVVEVEFINAILLYYFYKITYLALTLAKKPYADEYLLCAKAERERVKARYIDEDGRCKINEQCSVAMLIYYEIYDELSPLKNQLAKLISDNNFHLKCGMVGMRRLLHALSKCGLTDYAVKLLKADGYPGYKLWMDSGATSLWEKWDVNVNSDSKNHHMYSDFASWFIKTFAGISINEEKCGELEFILNPTFTDELSFVNLTYKTSRVNISISWERKEGSVLMRLEKEKDVKIIYNGKIIDKEINEFTIGEKK